MKIKKILGQYFDNSAAVSITLIATDDGYIVSFDSAQRKGDAWQQQSDDLATALDVFRETVLATIEGVDIRPEHQSLEGR